MYGSVNICFVHSHPHQLPNTPDSNDINMICNIFFFGVEIGTSDRFRVKVDHLIWEKGWVISPIADYHGRAWWENVMVT